MTNQDDIVIDGRQGEGGGQVLRTSLSLAATLGRTVTITNVRGGRRKPGLLRQHRTALRALGDITGGEIEGDELGSGTVRFAPGERIRGGDYHFGVGSAGSTMLVLQTVLPALMFADGPSTVTLEGGTHNPAAPPFESFAKSFLPCLRAIGADVTAELIRPGFFPAGGGALRVSIEPVGSPRALELMERGEAARPSCEVFVQNLDDDIAEREWKAFQKGSHWTRGRFQLRRVTGGRGPGNVMLATLPFENVTAIFASFGSRNQSSERVGTNLASLVGGYLKDDAPVDAHLADQLMLPLALLAGGRFRCSRVSEHARTNALVIDAFLPGSVTIDGCTVKVMGNMSGEPGRPGSTRDGTSKSRP